MLSVDGIDVFYGRAQVIFGLSLKVSEGEVVALMGRNGAGKSTTLKSIMGLLRVDRGKIAFDGHDITALEPYEIARLGLGFVPENRRIFGELTVRENLETGRRAGRKTRRDSRREWTPDRLFELFPNLRDMQDRRAAQTSGGEQQMLALARTLMGNPRLLLLDEPSEGLAPVIVDQLAESLKELKRDGLTVLISEQNLRFAASLADRAVVIEKGEVRHTGTMRALLEDEGLRRKHLAL